MKTDRPATMRMRFGALALLFSTLPISASWAQEQDDILTDTEIASRYDADNARCLTLDGLAKDSCQRQAKATREHSRLSRDAQTHPATATPATAAVPMQASQTVPTPTR